MFRIVAQVARRFRYLYIKYNFYIFVIFRHIWKYTIIGATFATREEIGNRRFDDIRDYRFHAVYEW